MSAKQESIEANGRLDVVRELTGKKISVEEVDVGVV